MTAHKADQTISAKRSVFSRVLSVPQTMHPRVRTLFRASVLAEFALLVGVYFVLRQLFGSSVSARTLPFSWCYLLIDLGFVLFELLYICAFGRSFSYLLYHTRRISREKEGVIDAQPLQAPFRTHAQHINDLSRCASARAEQQCRHEELSIRLINNISHSLRSPLRDVAESVRSLQSDGLSPQAEEEYLQRITGLSQEIEKTIDDLTRASRTPTDASGTSPVRSDAAEMLRHAADEFRARFDDKQLQTEIETPQQPLMIRADSEFLGNILDGILSAFAEDGVPQTHVCLTVKQAGEHIVVLFRGTVYPPREQSGDLFADRGCGLPLAKVYAELQGGSVYHKYGRDTLTVVLRFPAERSTQEV